MHKNREHKLSILVTNDVVSGTNNLEKSNRDISDWQRPQQELVGVFF